MRRNLGWCEVRANMKIRLETGTTTIGTQNEVTVGNIVTQRHNIQYNRNSGTVRR